MQSDWLKKIGVTICFAGIAGISALNAQESMYPVTGTVFVDDKRPVYMAEVKLSPGGYADTTDVSGHFKFNAIPAGKYILSVSAPYLGLENFRRNISVSSGESESLEILMHEKTYRIDEIVVMSGHEEVSEEMEKSSSFVTVVKRSEFENEATTVADVIEAAPGTTVSATGGLGDYTEVSLRGAYSNQVQVYIDGMLLNEAVGGAVNLGTIPLTNVESVEIWRSGAPAQFGGDASGGVVNIRTRDIRTGKRIFSLGYGSFNTLIANTVFNVPFEMSRLFVSLDYASSNNDFEYKSDNGTMYNKEDDYWARRSNDEYRTANLLGKFNHLFGNGVLLEMSEHLLSSRKNLPGKDNLRYSHASLETMKNLFQAKATVSPFLKDCLELQPAFHHIYSHERYRDIHGSVGWGLQDNIYKTNTYSFLVPLTVRVRDLAVFNFTPTARHESFVPEHILQETIPLSCDREQFALVFDTRIKTPGEHLIFTANIRRDRYYSSFDGEPSPQNRKTPVPQFNYTTNSHTGLKLRIWRNVSINCNYGDVTRVPSFYELFGDRGCTLSNPDLRPEHTYRWDAGGRIRFGKRSSLLSGMFECARFENNYRDLIQWYTNDGGFIVPENVSAAFVRGTEIVWHTFILSRFTCTGNWTFQESRVTGEKRKYYRDKKLPNRPENYGCVKIKWEGRRFVPFWSLDSKGGYFLDRANQEHKRYPGRTLHVLGISIPVIGGRCTITLLVKNITDEHTFDIQGLPKPGRSFTVTGVYTM